jgi:30S ribosomal protein S31
MGKGDKRSRKGKLFKGSYGKTRPHKPKRAKAATKR